MHHFGKKALIRPKGKELVFDTSQQSGVNAKGEKYTFADEYEWLGFTAASGSSRSSTRCSQNKTLRLDMFAYDLNEPDLIDAVLKLAKQGRVRVILDNAALHHTPASRSRRTSSRSGSRRPEGRRRSCAASSAATPTTRC